MAAMTVEQERATVICMHCASGHEFFWQFATTTGDSLIIPANNLRGMINQANVQGLNDIEFRHAQAARAGPPV